MESFTPTQEPDEGYSEHPLNTSTPASIQDNATALSLRSPADLSTCLVTLMPKLSVEDKKYLAMLILNELPTTAVADIVMTQLNPRLYIDFVRYLPPEICLKILGYLDAASLVRVALCCRGWHGLASDQKLWEKLYHLEGWKAIAPEITLAEQRKNDNPVTSQTHLQMVKMIDGGHVSKKRAISDPITSDENLDGEDYEMVDADVTVGQEHKDTHMSGTSIFGGSRTGGGGSSAQSNRVVRSQGFQMMESPASIPDGSSPRPSKGKGKAVAESSSVDSPLAEADSSASTLPKSTLWTYDWRDRRYRISWRYLYSMRRKLESNWERGSFNNFQLPHPSHPEEGHNECIYSLQYNSDYLVSGSRDRTLRIWNLHSKRLVRPPLTGHSGSVLCLQFDSDPEEDLIVSGSSDSDVILWRFSTGEILKRLQRAHRESVLNVKFDKRILVTCSKDKTIKIFNRQPLRPGDLGYSDSQVVGPVPVTLRNYGFDDSPMNQLAIKPPYSTIACLEGHGAAVNAVQICDKEIVSASGDRNIRLWDWPNQVVKRTFIGHSKGIACVQYDGRRIVSGSSDNEVKVFDCESGLEVASLRAHSNLVRTVQAGFGDLPYSREEDQLEARAIDQDYFQALNSGSLEAEGSERRRPRNPGSRRPEDITAYGAKLPPGGGGGPYGRIVSGSYDHSIIIWRRNREGAWKSAHVLRQEEGSAAALRQTSGTSMSTAPRRSPPVAAGVGSIPSQRIDHILENQSSSQSANVLPSLPSNLHRPPPVYTQVEHPIHATITPQTTASYTQMIDAAVPQGPAALHAALTSFPTMLSYNSHIQAAIDREANAITRSQLRQVVGTCLVRTQIAQTRIQESSQQALAAEASSSFAPQTSQHLPTPRPSQPLSLSQLLNGDPSDPSTSNQATPRAPTNGPLPPLLSSHSMHAQQSHEVLGQQSSLHIRLHDQSQSTPHLPQGENRVPGHGQPRAQVPTPAYEQEQTQVAPAQAASSQAAPSQSQLQLQLPQPLAHSQAPADMQVHPHITQTDASPARIFKLQFDARRIICCSQVSTIVGWDFCNGDAELEEVSRFFRAVE
ncbi:hypothetical protein F4861DRAFT_499256 [Xylaria intraflava]|nr:hypothetical protein F4861DRAFT_499256 [Xylaria intraflava]